MALRDEDSLWYYELHEGEDDVFTDVLLAHDAEYDEEEFLELVLEGRTAVIETFEEDTLSEAIARWLTETHGFLTIDDRKLRVAVNVSVAEGETAIAAVDEPRPRGGIGEEAEDFRSILVDIEPDDAQWDN